MPRSTGRGFQKSPWGALGRRRVLQDSWRSQEGSEVQGKAKGELWGVLNVLGELEHHKMHLEALRHAWRALGAGKAKCRAP